MADITAPDIERYCMDHTPPQDPILQKLVEVTHAETDLPQMQVGRLEGGFLRLLVSLIDAKRVVEVGTFTGYSTLAMASALPDDGRIITCDIDPDTTAIARQHWDQTPHGHKIELRLGDARDTTATLDGPFDLAFIDADKTGYATYYDNLLPKMRTGGLIVIDNTLWSGAVLDPQDADAKAIAAFNDMVQDDGRVENVLLPVRDGMMLARKR